MTWMAGSGAESVPDTWVAKPFPDGHFYSPVPDLLDIRDRAGSIFAAPDSVPGIPIDWDAQVELARTSLSRHVVDAPFSDAAGPNRYGFDNDQFGQGDALVWHAMLRHLLPSVVVEVGSGHSSAVLLDTVDLVDGWSPRITLVEPYPDRLRSVLRPEDNVDVRVATAQSVEQEVFDTLGAGDVLFIDSTHVSKVGSDVNRLLLDVLPRLAAGVVVHVHDIFYPFEYPPQWVFEGRAWTEAYVLRALLTNSNRLSVLWFNHGLAQFAHDRVSALLPGWSRNPGGSIYLQVS
jgi:hypothetical protein